MEEAGQIHTREGKCVCVHAGSRSREPGRREVMHVAEAAAHGGSALSVLGIPAKAWHDWRGYGVWGNPDLLSGLESWDSARLWGSSA